MNLPHKFHPEFGYFLRDAAVQRKLQIALAAIGFGLAVGVGSVLTLMPASQSQAGTESNQSVGVAARNAPWTNARGFKKRCAEQTWPYLNQECLKGTTRTVRRVGDSPDERGSTLTERARAAQADALAHPSKLASEPATSRSRSSRHRTRSSNRGYYGW